MYIEEVPSRIKSDVILMPSRGKTDVTMMPSRGKLMYKWCLPEENL